MKLSAAIFAVLGAGAVTAQSLFNQTGPFNLQIISTEAKWNGQYLAACHEGAAIEAFCPAGNSQVPFFFNYSSPNPADETTQGFLTWMLQGGNFNLSEATRLAYDPTTNLAVPMLYPDPSLAQYVGFSVDDFLYIQGFDPTVYPRNYSNTVQYYRWYICETNVGYDYDTLAWGLGESQPDNPTCSYVQVKRIFT
jgi:hypothetical protein